MPVINIEFDADKVPAEDMQKLCDGAHEIVSRVTKMDEAQVYAHSADYKAAIPPIEIFIRLSDHRIADADALMAELKQAFSEWKKDQNFSHPINMQLIPMSWKIESNI